MLKPFNAGIITNLVNNVSFKDTKIVDKQREESFEKGLIALYRTSNPNINAYLKVECGHTCFLQPTHVRRNSFACKTCSDSALFTKISKQVANFISQQGTKCTILRPCGHILELYKAKVESNKLILCSECLTEERYKVASVNNYEILHVSGKRSKIRFNLCGHTKDLLSAQLLKGNAVCRECLEEEYQASISPHGLVTLSGSYRVLAGTYRKFRLPCGHSKQLRIDHARDGVWTCDECGDGYLTKPSNVYLLKLTHADKEWLKVGFAQNVSVRISNYILTPGVSVEVLDTVQFITGKSAKNNEMAIHRKYKHSRIKKVEMKYYMENGHSECYPVDMLNILREEINRCRL